MIKLKQDTFSTMNGTLTGKEICGIESLTIKRNAKGLYNLYALMSMINTNDGQKMSSLIGMKSTDLSYKEKDFEFWIDRIRETQDITSVGIRLGTIEVAQSILYHLYFSKSYGTLVEFEILNKGEGELMNYNVFEELDKYTIQINVAGFSKDEVEVLTQDDIIYVRTKPETQLYIDDAKQAQQTFEKNKSECEIYLPNINSVEAELKDGILVLTASKAVATKTIDIK